MEDKKLNFNRPLLSVRRRFSSTVASQKDSRRKNEILVPTIAPVPSYKSELQSGPLRKPGNVPFVWEHSPGRPKDETKTQKQAKERPPSVPKLPPGRILKPKKQDLDVISQDSNVKKGPRKESLSPTEEKLTKFESSKGTKKDRSYSGDDDDDNGDTYMDALDTHPPSESFPSNRLESDVNQSGICSNDLKTQDFLMGDFLPAVKKHVIKEKAQEVKKVVHRENKKPQLITYGPNFLQFTGHDNEEDNDFDHDEHGDMSYKVCGLLPHFCLKGSVGLLNPVPGLSMRTRLPVSHANRTRVASSSANFEPARVAIYEHKPFVEHQKDQIFKNKSTEATNQKAPQKLEGSGLYNRLQGRVNSNDISESSDRKDVNSPKKGLVSFKELLADEYEKEKETNPQDPTVEKTLYVDTIHKSNPYSSSKNGQSDFKENDKGIFVILDADKSKVSGLELPAPPPLPKSPSDSWLWRTLPSVSSKRSNPKYPSSNPAPKFDKHVRSRDSQGLLLPIPET